jgi:hypothetical protein
MTFSFLPRPRILYFLLLPFLPSISPLDISSYLRGHLLLSHHYLTVLYFPTPSQISSTGNHRLRWHSLSSKSLLGRGGLSPSLQSSQLFEEFQSTLTISVFSFGACARHVEIALDNDYGKSTLVCWRTVLPIALFTTLSFLSSGSSVRTFSYRE